jgi:hypothetical protein
VAAGLLPKLAVERQQGEEDEDYDPTKQGTGERSFSVIELQQKYHLITVISECPVNSNGLD